MTLLTPHTLDGVDLRNHPVVFAFAPWFDSRYILDDNIFTRYISGDHLPDDIPLFALDYDFCSLMCASDTELKTPNFGQRSGRKRFVHTYEVHWG